VIQIPAYVSDYCASEDNIGMDRLANCVSFAVVRGSNVRAIFHGEWHYVLASIDW